MYILLIIIWEWTVQIYQPRGQYSLVNIGPYPTHLYTCTFVVQVIIYIEVGKCMSWLMNVIHGQNIQS